MKISFDTIVPYKSYKNSIKRTLSSLKYDTVSFGSMKKNQFYGLDLYVVERFKAPIEKFKTKSK